MQFPAELVLSRVPRKTLSQLRPLLVGYPIQNKTAERIVHYGELFNFIQAFPWTFWRAVASFCSFEVAEISIGGWFGFVQ